MHSYTVTEFSITLSRTIQPISWWRIWVSDRLIQLAAAIGKYDLSGIAGNKDSS